MPAATRRSVAAVACVCAAVALGACGGDEGSTTAPAPATSAPGAAAATAPGPADSTPRQGGAAKRERQQSRAEYERKRYGAPSAESAPFSHYSRPQGGPSLHLAEFGEEAGSSDRKAAQAVVVAYLADLAAERWESACSSLAAGISAEIKPKSEEGASCGQTLKAAIATFAETGVQLGPPPDSIASLRIQQGGRAGEGAGFALFHVPDGEDRWLALRKEGGEWRLISIAPQPFR